MDNWKPKNTNDIIGHVYQIKNFKKWLNDENKKNNSIIISGNHGIGKSTMVKLALKEHNYDFNIIYPNDIKKLRTNGNFSDYFNYNNSIFIKMNLNKNKKLAIVFDEIESISLTSEKKFIINIHKENNKRKNFPLIFISNNKHSKLINDLKKNSFEIKLFTPDSFSMKKFIKKIFIKNNVKLESKIIYDKIIEFSQFDIRRLCNLLKEIMYHYTSKTISIDDINKFIKKSREKNKDIGLFDSTLNIINNKIKYDEIFKLYESEKVLLPLNIHENYKKKILSKDKNIFLNNDKLFQMVKISDSLSRGDNIETSIYTDQNWYLQNIHGFYSCLNTSYWINKNDKNKILSSDIKFSSDLNKTSLKNINRKNINNLINIINKKSIEEILILNKIANKSILQKTEAEFIKTLKSYKKDLTVKDIELFLKIDKTIDFLELSSKQKKDLLLRL